MANAIYPSGKDGIMKAEIQFVTDTFKIALLTNGTYTDSDTVLADVSADIVDSSGGTGIATLTSNSVSNGVYTAANATFSSVPGTEVAVAYVLYRSGVTSTGTDPLIAFYDTQSAGDGSISITTNGGNIIIDFDASAGIVKM